MSFFSHCPLKQLTLQGLAELPLKVAEQIAKNHSSSLTSLKLVGIPEIGSDVLEKICQDCHCLERLATKLHNYWVRTFSPSAARPDNSF